MDSLIRFACAQCGKKLKAPTHAAGVTTKCPKCASPCKIPDSAESPPSPAAQAPPPDPEPTQEAPQAPAQSGFPLLIGGGVALAALVLVGTVVGVFLNMGSNETGSPADPRNSSFAGTNPEIPAQVASGAPTNSQPAQQSNVSRPSRFGGGFALTVGGLPMQPVPLAPGQKKPKQLIGVLGDGRFRHEKVVRRVLASPNGSQVLTVTGNPEALHMWDAKTGHIQYVLPAIQSGNSFQYTAFSPDGSKFALYGDVQGTSDSAVRVHDSATGEQLAERGGLGRLGNFARPVSFSPDGKFVLIDDKQMFDVATLEDSELTTKYLPEKTSPRSSSPFYHVEFSPDVKTVYLKIGNDKVIWVDVGSGNEILRFEDAREARSCQVSVDGNFLSVEKGQELHIFDRAGKLHGKTERRSRQTVIDETWLYNVETSVVAGLELINYQTGAKQYLVEPRRVGAFKSLGVSRIENLLLFPTSDPEQMNVYDTSQRKIIASFPRDIAWQDPIVSADRKWFGLLQHKEGIVRLFNTDTGSLAHQLSIYHGNEDPTSVAALDISLSANAAFAAVGTELVKWDLSSGAKQIREDDFIDVPAKLAIAPNLRYLACSIEASYKAKGDFRLWDLADGSQRSIQIESTEMPAGFAFSPDGQTFFVAGQDASRLIEVEGRRQRYLAPKSGNITLYFSSAGTHIFTPDRTLDATTGDVIHDLAQPRLKSLWAYSPEHEVCALAGEIGACTIYDPKTNKVLSVFKAHYGPMGFLTGPDQLAIWNRRDGGIELISLIQVRGGLALKGAEANDNSLTPLVAYGDTFNFGSNNADTRFGGESPLEMLNRQKKMDFPKAQTQKVKLQGMGENYIGSAPHFIGGNRVAALQDNDLRVWNARTGELLFETQISSHLNAMASSPDGRYIGVSTANGQILIFDVDAK